MKLTKKDMRKVFNMYANGTSITQLVKAHNTTREKIIGILQLSGISNPAECVYAEEGEPFRPFPDTLLPSYTEKQLEAMTEDILRATLSAYANEMGRRVIKAERDAQSLRFENNRLKHELLRRKRTPRIRVK